MDGKKPTEFFPDGPDAMAGQLFAPHHISACTHYPTSPHSATPTLKITFVSDPAAEFEADAKSKIEELAALLSEREEEFYSYQQNSEEVGTGSGCGSKHV